MPTFTTVRRVPVRPDAMWAYVTTLSNWSAFTGYGPLPGIVEASLPEGEGFRLGARIKVRNTDGSEHHEVVTAFEPHTRYEVRMELAPPPGLLMRHIDESLTFTEVEGGTELRRTFTTVPRSFFTWPMVWLLTHVFLKRAVDRHDAAVGAALAG